jgi:MarR family transcriptional regulator, transcriptional regulator for hemolysin
MGADENFGFELNRVSRRWRARLDERLRHTGLTQARWIALLQLSKAGPLSQKDLAERVGVEGPTLVRVLDNLEKQGLIVRREGGEDRRVKEVHLTAAAGPILDEITRISTGLRRELLAGIPAADLAKALGVLRTIADQLEGQ